MPVSASRPLTLWLVVPQAAVLLQSIADMADPKAANMGNRWFDNTHAAKLLKYSEVHSAGSRTVR